MILAIRRTVAVAVAVAVALVAVWYFTFWSPQNQKLTSAHKAHAAAEQQISDLGAQVAQLDILVKQAPADSARLDTLKSALPDNPSLDAALNQLHQAATAAGVALTTVGPSAPAGSGPGSPPSATAGAPAITLTMTVGGPYPRMMTFLTNLSHMRRALVVDRVALTGTSQLTASIGARIFYSGAPTP